MRNKPFTRVLCLVLALLCLSGGGVVAVGADGTQNTNLTDKSIVDYRETLDTISYADYQAENFTTAGTLAYEISVALTRNWTFVNDNIITTMEGDQWVMFVLGKTYASLEEAQAAGLKVGTQEGDLYQVSALAYRVIGNRYETLEGAKNAGYPTEDLAYIEIRDGREALYTPSRGTVSWNISLAGLGITTATLVSIALDYFPVIAKSSAIEREFYINGVAPYSESRSLRFSKIWSFSSNASQQSVLQAGYVLGKKQNLADMEREAAEAGFVKDQTYYVLDDPKALIFHFPEVITAKNSAFIEKYGLRFFTADINRNEIRPTQMQDPEWTTYVLADSDGFSHFYTAENGAVYNSNYFGFVLTPDSNGNVKITLDGVNEPMSLSDLTLMPYKAPDPYSLYLSTTQAAVGVDEGRDVIKLEAENNSHTSTNVVYPIEDRTSPLCSPVDTTRTVLNTIGTEKWSTPGQWVEYTFSVESAGWYDILARFKQSYLDGMYVSRSLEIFTNYDSLDAFKAALATDQSAGYYNGLPFAEAADLRYDYGTDWQITSLTSKGNTSEEFYQIYFRPGVEYTIRIQVTLGSMSDQVREIERILNALNTCYLDIIKLTGTTPDDYRNYDFYRVLPGTLKSMIAEKNALAAISESLRVNSGVASTYTGICDKLVDLLQRMVQDGGEPIAKNLDTFKSYVGSLGTFLTDAKTQPLQLDYLVIQPAAAKDPKAAPNFFQAFWHEILSFVQSFFRDYNSMGATEVQTDASKTVSVWVPYGRDQANVIRNLSTNSFTQKYGTSVDLKLVAGGTLLPSILAGIGPDVYHGLDDSVVINYAIRGALEPLEDLENFAQFTNENFNAEAIDVLGIADADNVMHYYGLPETQTFSMMFVRLDVLADLDIEIPKTWGDLLEAQTTLQSNNMEIGVSADYQIFLYQSGGDLWADDGMRINLDSPEGLAAFEYMCDLFTQRSFPYTYDAANRFRTGEMPIIIAGYTGLYNQLKVFATELDGCWTFVPVPGTESDNGKIDNRSMSSVSSIVMIAGTQKRNNAWDYMRWYTGAETQEGYANEMVAIIGDSAKHPTANENALSSMPWTYDEYIEVYKQFQNLAAVKNFPGYYYIGRYTNFAFLAAYNDGADPKTELLSYINTINTEITRKRQEFKLETLELGQTLAEKRLGQIDEALSVLGSKFDANTYSALIESTKYAIANASSLQDDYDRLQFRSKDFAAILASKNVEYKDYFVNVTKQTMDQKNGGYSIDSLTEGQLLYFLQTALESAAKAFASY